MFKEAIRLAKPNIELSAEKATAMLYTLADKFLDRAELDEIKEVMRMTRLGQMLMDEGMEKGIELNQTDSIKKLMKNMNLTIDQAMNALEVPTDKREKYRKTITPDKSTAILTYHNQYGGIFLNTVSYIFYLFISLYCTIFLIFPTKSNVSTMVTILNGIFI